MHTVYLIRSLPHPDQHCIGLTGNLEKRLQKHNESGSPYTSKYKPWELVTYLSFSSPNRAAAFEKFLKSGSGRAFARKRLW
ncbi:MAG TPA: GIY-YIG nuclease family protein [Oceanipulchritudo sp.]|nr:GIY-YIG nuclease family protein [Oceanipulchritudo sp.]